jgi:hypothetical protein
MSRLLVLLVALLLPAALLEGRGDDPCAAFSWDVHHERDLFGQQPVDLASGKALNDAPALTPERLYELELRAQPEVTFAAPPSRTWPMEASYAGIARLTVESGGVYRLALDQPAWVDVVVSGSLLKSLDFQGRPGCSTPHKIVEFALPGGKPMLLEFSSSVTPSIKVSVSRSPAQTQAH